MKFDSKVPFPTKKDGHIDILKVIDAVDAELDNLGDNSVYRRFPTAARQLPTEESIKADRF